MNKRNRIIFEVLQYVAWGTVFLVNLFKNFTSFQNAYYVFVRIIFFSIVIKSIHYKNTVYN